jgi:carboxyl-terminal processing protease
MRARVSGIEVSNGSWRPERPRRNQRPWRRRRCLSIAFCLTLAFATTPAARAGGPTAGSEESQSELRLFLEAFRVVQEHYVDTTLLSAESLIRGAIRGMLDSLGDSHTRFLTPSEAEELRKTREGEFGGIGVQIAIENGRLTVVAPMEGTPARRAGVEAGDMILKIDDAVSEIMTIDLAVAALRGRAGSPVVLTLKRYGVDTPITISLVREIIRVRSVRHDMIGDLGYIRISSFTELTPEQLDDALKDLSRRRTRGLIVDLRNNPGGLLEIAVAVSNRFVDSAVIVSMVGRDPGQTRAYRTTAVPGRTGLPLVVIVNRNSASASEIFAGAMRDLGRGVVVGERTFGKGSVQTVVNLRDGSQIVLTTARYFTPSGRSIHGVGVEPDSGMLVDGAEPTETETVEIGKLGEAGFFRDFVRDRETFSGAELDRLAARAAAAGLALSRVELERHVVAELARRNDHRLYLSPHLDPPLRKAVHLLKATLRLQN